MDNKMQQKPSHGYYVKHKKYIMENHMNIEYYVEKKPKYGKQLLMGSM